MAGSIRRKHKGWELAVSAGTDPVTGRRRRIVRYVKGPRRDAELALARLLVEVDRGRHAGTNRSMSELFEAWLELAGRNLSPKTLHDYRRTVELILEPRLGEIRLDRLDAATLDRLYASLAVAGPAGRPLAPTSIRKVHAITRAALQQALKWGWVPVNVATLATPPSARKTDVVPPGPEDVLTLIDAARSSGDDDLVDLVWTAAVTGLRRGELCGLRWDDLDFDRGIMDVQRGVIEVDSEVIVKDTKTHQRRRIAIDRETVDLLRARRRRCAERALACGVSLGPWVFSTSPAHDGPQPPEKVTGQFRRLADRVDIAARFHDLRHFAATQALDAGIPLPTVSKRLGHRDTSTTANIYAHSVSQSDREAADVLGGLLRRGDN